MAIVTATQPTPASLSETSPVFYRGWKILQQRFGKQIWLRWQHPEDNFPRYGFPIEPGSGSQRLDEAQQLIDLILQLETA